MTSDYPEAQLDGFVCRDIRELENSPLQRIARSNSWIGVTAFGLRIIVRSTVEWSRSKGISLQGTGSQH
jgi:hypothetical protein